MQKPARSKGEKAQLLSACFRILTNILGKPYSVCECKSKTIRVIVYFGFNAVKGYQQTKVCCTLLDKT